MAQKAGHFFLVTLSNSLLVTKYLLKFRPVSPSSLNWFQTLAVKVANARMDLEGNTPMYHLMLVHDWPCV